ncbi:MAG: glycosyltransferase family 4 protein [Phycisphaerae bacterium]|nr:glycosyltransferase family 4 protein [Phycisphaerae bacterium]
MKLLILTNNPQRGSFKDRIGRYLDIFRAAGIEPTVAVLSSNPLKRWGQYRQADTYDVVLLHKKCLNFLDARFFRPRKAKVIFNYDDAVMFNDKGCPTPAHQKRFRRSLQKADAVLVGSSYLADRARPYHSNIIILPLGLKTDDYHPAAQKSDDGNIRLVWIGSRATLGYIAELKPVLQKLAARYPGLVLRLIGDDFIDMEGVTIEKMKWTPHARGYCLGQCDIGLAPLPDNPFTRGKCSFKVLEYSASGLPVVASPIGTNPDHVIDGQTGYLVRTEQEWLEKLSLLIENPALRCQMGQNGIQQARNYDISAVGRKLCELIVKTAT